MDFFLLIILVVWSMESCSSVSDKFDIRKYYDKPYCEKAKVGNQDVEKCYKVIEVQK